MTSQWAAAARGHLLGWTIYAPTCRDLPGFYVARAWVTGRGETAWPFVMAHDYPEGRVTFAYVGCCCQSLDEARRCVPPTSVNIPRHSNDDLVIVESWI